MVSAGVEQTGGPVQSPTQVPGRAVPLGLESLLFILLTIATMLAFGASVARADVVGTGYSELDLVDLQWATDHLGYRSPADLQSVGVGVIDFLLQISGRSASECELGLADQLDPYGPYRFATTWTGTDLAVLDRVADHYCISREQTQAYGATILSFLAGIDAEQNGTTAEPQPVVDVIPPPDLPFPEAFGNGNRTVLLDQPPPVDHRVVFYEHAGAGAFRVVGRDLSGEIVEVIVDRMGPVTGRALADEPGSIAVLDVIADGEWALSFNALTESSDILTDEVTLGSGDEVLLVPAAVRGTTLRYRHVGDGRIALWALGFDGNPVERPESDVTPTGQFLSQEGGVVSRVRIPAGTRILKIEAGGEWGFVNGDFLPPGRPSSVEVVARDRAVDVSWRAPVSGGSEITGYQIDHREISGDEGDEVWNTAVVTGSARGATIEGLRNGVAHHFRIAATNEVGVGLHSLTTSAAPISAVEVVEVEGLVATAGDSFVDLAWSTPDAQEVVSYTVVYFDETRVNSGTAVIRGATSTTRPTSIPPSVASLRSTQRRMAIRLPSIVGGTKVSVGERDHAVALLSSGQPDAFQAHYCGGTLVAPRWVVTAAHCIVDKSVDDVEVVGGLADLHAVTTADRIDAVALHVHESYDANRILHDIGLIELASDSAGTPIPWQDDGNLPMAGTAVEVAGWGAITADSERYESILKVAKGQILAGPGEHYCGSWRGFRGDYELCVGGPAGVGACGGDSGGPVTAELGMLRLIGVTSYGLAGACADPTYPNVATRLSGHSAWIEARVGDPWRTFDGLTSPIHTVDGLVNGRTYTFHVTAVDGMGRSVGPMQVTVSPVGPPAAPTGLTGRGGDTAAILAWTAAYSAEDDPVVDHVVQYSADGVQWTTIDVGTTTETSLKVTGLANETILKFRVMAVNSRGPGPASEPVTVVVGQPAAPTRLAAIAGDEHIQLSWLAPADDGGSPILDYVVERRIDGGWTIVDDEYSATTTAVIHGLTNGTQEDFRVAAVTAVGRGPTGSVVSAVAGRPDPVSALKARVGDGNVTLSWTPSTHDGGSPILDYRIEYSVDDGSSWGVVDGEVGTSTTATVYGLRNGTEYQFSVAAVTEIGMSGTTSVAAVPATIPDQATSLMAVGEVDGLVFRWRRPSDGGSAITRILVDLAVVGSEGWKTYEAGPATTTARIGGLVTGSEYLVRVTYENGIGAGEPSDAVRVLIR